MTTKYTHVSPQKWAQQKTPQQIQESDEANTRAFIKHMDYVIVKYMNKVHDKGYIIGALHALLNDLLSVRKEEDMNG